MVIKKFVGKTEEAAIETAKGELGENIVIMNVRNAKRHKVLSFFQRPKIEVTVAKEDNPEKRQSNDAMSNDLRDAFKQVAQIARQTDDNTLVNLSDEAVRLNSDKIGADRQPAFPKEKILEDKLDSLQDIIFQKMQQTEDKTKEELNNQNVSEQNNEPEKEKKSQEMIHFTELLYHTMSENEIEEKYVKQIIEEMEQSTKPDIPFDVALANIYQRMILKFGKPIPIKPAESGPKVVFFVGPTGVGKTTTIAKLASQFCIVNKKKVALLTADTYRIAAAEQLRTYASILDVPFRVIYATDDLKSAIQDYADMDYIFVDTTGHSQLDGAQKEMVEDFISAVDEKADKEVYLVLSATTKYRDLYNITDVYSKTLDYNLIFTKIDETKTLGNLLNIKLRTGASLSYITCGQNVPEDIEVFNPQKTVKLLLGGKN